MVSKNYLESLLSKQATKNEGSKSQLESVVMNSFTFIFVVFVISVGVYVFLKAQGDWKKALVELVRALTVIFSCITRVGESFGRVIRAISNGLKYFDEEFNLEAIKEREDQKEALAWAAKTIYSEWKALRDSDEDLLRFTTVWLYYMTGVRVSEGVVILMIHS